LTIEVGLLELDVRTSATIEGSELVLRQIVTNRSSSTLQLRGSAQVPYRERKARPINDLRANSTQMVEYRFSSGLEQIGAKVRLSLRPINDDRRVHHVELIVR
jgi:hypothetical protein